MRGELPRPGAQRVALAAGALLLALSVFLGLWLRLKPLQRRFVDGDQSALGDGHAVSLGPGVTAGQTFVARHAGLAGAEFWLLPATSLPLSLTLHLRSEPSAQQDLAVATVTIPPGAEPGHFRFGFAPRADSLGKYYYAWIEAQQPGVDLPLAEGLAYLDGAAYQGGEPLDAQTPFRLVYAPGPVIVSLLKAAPRGLGLVGAILLLLVFPGWAMLAWLGPGLRTTWAERLGLSAGIGLALLPLLLLWTATVGLQMGALVAWIPAGAGVAYVLWRARRWRPLAAARALARWAHSPGVWPDSALVVVLALITGTRLLTVRTVEVPMWGDGYQHTMITQLLVDHGGLFDSWQPYSAIDRFTYHFGFHSTAAALHWMTALPASQAVLWTGQLLSVLAVTALYPLAVRISGSRWGGVVCVLVAGLLSPMPAGYTNWGRYTQLAGQVILPAAAWLTWELVEKPEDRWRLVALVALVAGGLALTHYRVLAFYAVFVVALLPFCLRRKTLRQQLLRTGAALLGAAVLFLPWFLRTFEGAAIGVLGHQLTTMPAQVSTATRENNTVGSLQRYLAPAWWLALPLGLCWASLRRMRGPLVVAAWSAAMILAANPAWLGLPGTGAISNFAIVIAAYIPAALLAGFLAAELIERVPQRRLALAGCALLASCAGMWGARERLGDVDTGRHAYVTRPDVRAAAWIRENTPADARFLIDSTPAFGATAIVGTDGGWWLPLLAARQNTVPPLSYANELGQNTTLRQQLERAARLAETVGSDGAVAAAALPGAGVTHVYVGQRRGALGDGSSAALRPDRLLGTGAFEPVYHQDRVWIFRLVPAVGQ